VGMTLVTAPTAEPVSVIEMKDHLRIEIDETAEDAILAKWIKAARLMVEAINARRLITQTWDCVLDRWPSGSVMKLPYPPLQSVTHVKYTDTAGTESTWSSDDYIVDTDACPGRIGLAYGEIWPTTTLRPIAGIAVRFVCGYGDAADVPEHLVQAVKLVVAHMYENREITDLKDHFELPYGASRLIEMDRIYSL